MARITNKMLSIESRLPSVAQGVREEISTLLPLSILAVGVHRNTLLDLGGVFKSWLCNFFFILT